MNPRPERNRKLQGGEFVFVELVRMTIEDERSLPENASGQDADNRPGQEAMVTSPGDGPIAT